MVEILPQKSIDILHQRIRIKAKASYEDCGTEMEWISECTLKDLSNDRRHAHQSS